MTAQIWALFSVDNAYDQPLNNLVAWWSEKPRFDTLSKAMGYTGFPCLSDESTLNVVNVWQGSQVKDGIGTEWRLRHIDEGILPDEPVSL